jgi:hypothetical protein
MIGCQETSTSFGLEIEDTVLAKKEAGTWQPVKEAKFKKGDEIGLVLLNVKGFKKGKDGLNRIDLDVQVKGPDGEIILEKKNILGEAGHVNLKNNIAESPVGSFSTTPELESGKYTIKVTIKDKIGGGSASTSKSFTLE